MSDTVNLQSGKSNVFIFNLFQLHQFTFVSCEHISLLALTPVVYLANILAEQLLAISIYNVVLWGLGFFGFFRRVVSY